MSSIFKTVGWEVQQLVDAVDKGIVQLPDLQRPFVWPKTKVRDLLDSMYRGYPVGELMFWNVAAEGDTRAIGAPTDRLASHQIIDGQQRLTSLYAVLKGKSVRDEDYRQKHITISFNPLTHRFEVWTPAQARSAEWIEDVAEFFKSPFQAQKSFEKRYEAAKGELSDELAEQLSGTFTKLHDLTKYEFEVVEILATADKKTVADIFVRINSEGVTLKAYDYILTWLSVFWPEGREQLEHFARDSRVTTERASELAERHVRWTGKNHYIKVETGQLVRVLVAIGQGRAKLSDAYNALQAKDRVTGAVDANRQEHELNLLKAALPTVLNPLHWDEFIMCLPQAGFRSGKGITSATNLISSYVIWLLGRSRYDVDLPALRVLIARWLFMSQLTWRYTGSGESQLQKDIDRFAALEANDVAGFQQIVDEVIRTELTPDYWEYRMPEALVTSMHAMSPAYQCYLAALNILDADMFMLGMQVRTWMDPTLAPVRGLEGHHLFPREYQRQTLGIRDTKVINQAANFAPTDWDTNSLISDRPPKDYWPELNASRGQNVEWLAKQRYWHALPDDWHLLPYDEFLQQRRKLMAMVTRDAFEKLSAGTSKVLQPVAVASDARDEWGIGELLSSGALRRGDSLTTIDAGLDVEAVVTDDGTILIDGIHEFDSLDEAARSLGVTNVPGLDYWAFDTEGESITLADLAAQAEAA